MELTNELKARFFALYLGQKVFYKVISQEIISVVKPVDLCYVKGWVFLRPLSSITEEEALELADIDFEHPPNEPKVKWVNEYIEHIIEYRNSSDYLRSKGFALPFMGIEVEQWVDLGVVKLKTE